MIDILACVIQKLPGLMGNLAEADHVSQDRPRSQAARSPDSAELLHCGIELLGQNPGSVSHFLSRF
jgi:hypothetical protein